MDPRIQIKYVDTKSQLAVNQTQFHTWWMESSASFVEYYGSVDVFLQPFLSFESKANSAECCVEKKAGRSFRGKQFANGEAKAQICEFGDDETVINFIGFTWSSYVELLLLARKEWLRKPGECWSRKRSCWSKCLETDAQHESVSNRTLSSVETRFHSRKQKGASWKQERVEAQARHAPGNRSQVWNKIEAKNDSGNVRAPMHHTLGNVCKYTQKELDGAHGVIKFKNWEVRTNIVVWVLFMSSSMTAAVHLG